MNPQFSNFLSLPCCHPAVSLLAVPYFWDKLSSFMLLFLYHHQDICAFSQDQFLESNSITASLCYYEKENTRDS